MEDVEKSETLAGRTWCRDCRIWFLELSRNRAPDSSCEMIKDYLCGKLDVVIQVESCTVPRVLAGQYLSVPVSASIL